MELDIWRIHILIGMLFVTVSFPLMFKDKASKTFIALWMYCLLSALWIAFFPSTYKREFVTQELSTMAKQGAVQAYAMLLVVPAVILNAGKNLGRYLSWVSILNIIPVMIFNFGIFNVNSMDSTAMAIGVIYLASREDKSFFDKLMCLIGCFSIGYIKGSTGLICLFIGIFFLAIKNLRAWKIIISSIVGLAALVIALNIIKVKSFEYRIEGWKAVMSWWKNHAPVWFGMGPGSFEWLAPFIKIPTGEIYLWMHNDYFQFVFEHGYIGAILAGLVIIIAAGHSFKTYLFPAVMTSLAAMFAYFPGHFFLTQALMLVILFESFRLKPRPIY